MSGTTPIGRIRRGRLFRWPHGRILYEKLDGLDYVSRRDGTLYEHKNAGAGAVVLAALALVERRTA